MYSDLKSWAPFHTRRHYVQYAFHLCHQAMGSPNKEMECVLHLVMSCMERNPTFKSEQLDILKYFDGFEGKIEVTTVTKAVERFLFYFIFPSFRDFLALRKSLGHEPPKSPLKRFSSPPAIYLWGALHTLYPKPKFLQPFRLNNLCHGTLVHRPVTHNIQPLLYSRLLFLPFGKSLI